MEDEVEVGENNNPDPNPTPNQSNQTVGTDCDRKIFKDLLPEDEILSVSKDAILFGRILEENSLTQSFSAEWRSITQKDKRNWISDILDTSQVHLVNRQHSEGSKVMHKKTGEIGDVLEAVLHATIRLPYNQCVIEDVPMHLLESWTTEVGELIYAGGWIGVVERVNYNCRLKFDDGEHAEMIISQHVHSERSFGFHRFDKRIPPHEKLKITPTNEEFQTAKWLGTSFVDKFHHWVHNYHDKEACIVSTEVHTMEVNWIRPVDENSSYPMPMPARELGVELLEQPYFFNFDIVKKESSKQKSIVRYKIRESDEMLSEEVMEDRFLKAYASKGGDIDSPQRKKHRGEHKPEPPAHGETVFAEVLRLHHLYKVQWMTQSQNDPDPIPTTDEIEIDSHENQNQPSWTAELGTDLSPTYKPYSPLIELEHFLFYERAIVFTKVPLEEGDHVLTFHNCYGVTQHREINYDFVSVDFYKIEMNGSIQFLSRMDLPPYELMTHPIYGGFRRGAVVETVAGTGGSGIKANLEDKQECSSSSSSRSTEAHLSEPEIGMVVNIDNWGHIVAHIGPLTNGVPINYFRFSPADLRLINLKHGPTPNTPDCSSPTVVEDPLNPAVEKLDKTDVLFYSKVACDLQQFMESGQTDIRIQKLVTGTQFPVKFNVLMTGPQDTPYEDGLFLFNVTLGQNYPRFPPRVEFASGAWLPEYTFISHDIMENGVVMHPMLSTELAPGGGEEPSAWNPEFSLLQVLEIVRRDIFVPQPHFSSPALRLAKKADELEAHERKLLTESIFVNSSIVIATVDLLFALHGDPPHFWQSEIEQHFCEVAPRFVEKFHIWITSPLGIHGNLSATLKFHLFPLSNGFVVSLGLRKDRFWRAIKAMINRAGHNPSSSPKPS